MKRPFALIGFTYLISLMAATFLGADITMWLAIAMFCLFIIFLFIKRTRTKIVIPVAMLVAAVALTVYSVSYNINLKPIKELEGKNATISGVICDLPYEAYGNYYYTIKTDMVEVKGNDDVIQKVKLRLSCPKAIDAQPYNRVTINVSLFKSGEGKGFSRKSYYASRGIHILAYSKQNAEAKVEEIKNKPLYYYALKVRQNMIKSINILLPSKEAGLARGILLGDKTGINYELQQGFSTIGVYHLLAVSGIHTSVVGYFLLMLLTFLKVPRRFAAFFSAIGVICFMAITCFSPSVMRAGIMTIIYFLGIMISRQRDSLNSLGLAVLIITVINPFSGGDIGLLLSFFSTLGIILLSKKIEIWIKEKAVFLKYGKVMLIKSASIISVTISATLFSLPMSILIFKRVPLIGLISNLLIVSPSTIMLVLIGTSSLINLITPLSFIAKPFALVAGIIIKYIIVLVNALAKIPFTSISTSQPFMLLWLAGSLLMLGVCIYLSGDAKLLRVTALLSSIILFVGILSYQICMRNVTQLAVLDTGNSCSIVLTKNKHAAVLFYGGEPKYSNKLKDHLFNCNINKVDCLVIPNKNKKISEFSSTILKTYTPGAIVAPDYEETSLLEYNYGRKVLFKENAGIKLWDNVNIYVVNTKHDEFLSIKINDIEILLSNSKLSGECISEYGTPHFFITSNPNQNCSDISSIYTILSMKPEDTYKCIKNNCMLDKMIIATAGDGDVLIDMKDSNNICIRRNI